MISDMKFLNVVFFYANVINVCSYTNFTQTIAYSLLASDGTTYTIQIIQGDLLALDTTKNPALSNYAIVNGANKYLQLGGGVAGAIRTKDTSGLVQRECDLFLQKNTVKEIPVGTNVLTKSGTLFKTHSITHIIHAVGPDYRDETNNRNFEQLLQKTYSNILSNTTNFNKSLPLKVHNKEQRIKTVACPSISTGIFSAPLEEAATIAAHTIVNDIYDYACSSNKYTPNTFIMVLYNDKDFQVYKEAFENAISKKKGFILTK